MYTVAAKFLKTYSDLESELTGFEPGRTRLTIFVDVQYCTATRRE